MLFRSAIEKGVGHVHAAFTELRPEGIEDNVDRLNTEMLQRVGQRAAMRERWKIGEPYRGQPQRTVEARVMANRERTRRGFPPFARSRNPWTEHSLAQAIGQAIAEALFEAKLLKSRPQLHTSDRAGGYTRLFLERSDQDDNALFATSLQEALAPLDLQPRYLIPRDIVRVEPTWIGQRTGNMIPLKGFNELADAYLALNAESRARIRIDFAGAFASTFLISLTEAFLTASTFDAACLTLPPDFTLADLPACVFATTDAFAAPVLAFASTL